MPTSQIFEAKDLAPCQNLSLLQGRGIGSSFIAAENVNYSRITGGCKEKALDKSEKKVSYEYLQNACQKWVSVRYFKSEVKAPKPDPLGLNLDVVFDGYLIIARSLFNFYPPPPKVSSDVMQRSNL